MQVLVQFELMWHAAWIKSIPSTKAGLNATLLVRHPTTRELHVNFDEQIVQLLRETKCLQRMKIEVPENSLSVLLQEAKFKSYTDQLSMLINGYRDLVGKTHQQLQPLLKVHLQRLEKVVEPALLSLTWQSLNIEAYIVRFIDAVSAVEALVSKARDILEIRVYRPLKQIARSSLVMMPENASFALEEFVQLEETHPCHHHPPRNPPLPPPPHHHHRCRPLHLNDLHTRTHALVHAHMCAHKRLSHPCAVARKQAAALDPPFPSVRPALPVSPRRSWSACLPPCTPCYTTCRPAFRYEHASCVVKRLTHLKPAPPCRKPRF